MPLSGTANGAGTAADSTVGTARTPGIAAATTTLSSRGAAAFFVDFASAQFTIAARSAGSPGVGEYLWFAGTRHASTAASTMCAGVEKSGSPAPNPITGLPSAFRALAFALTASVADGAMAQTRRESSEVTH